MYDVISAYLLRRAQNDDPDIMYLHRGYLHVLLPIDYDLKNIICGMSAARNLHRLEHVEVLHVQKSIILSYKVYAYEVRYTVIMISQYL